MGWLSDVSEPAGSTWSVTDLTAYIRDLFAVDFRLQSLSVAGEISNFTRARSGHLYFTLKDAGAQLKCVMWRTAAEKLSFRPQDGDAVTVSGRISVYEAQGAYQLYADEMSPAGRGQLAEAFERLKAALAVEGLFEPAHKKDIPVFPRRIGIVTSADAAALRDILNVLRRRYPLVSVLIAPTLVQGPEAPAGIVRSLLWLDGRDDVDTIIVARGGGSMEDLWAFNDETVARAIFGARHPVISGVGHEVDFTIADFVADLRAPTPSAAAELAVPDMSELTGRLADLRSVLDGQIRTRLQTRRQQLTALTRALGHVGPARQLILQRQQLDTLSARLDQRLARRLDGYQNRLALAAARLAAVGPQATLARGYAIVRRRADGAIVRAADAVQPGDEVDVQVADGAFTAAVTATDRE